MTGFVQAKLGAKVVLFEPPLVLCWICQEAGQATQDAPAMRVTGQATLADVHVTHLSMHGTHLCTQCQKAAQICWPGWTPAQCPLHQGLASSKCLTLSGSAGSAF